MTLTSFQYLNCMNREKNKNIEKIIGGRKCRTRGNSLVIKFIPPKKSQWKYNPKLSMKTKQRSFCELCNKNPHSKHFHINRKYIMKQKQRSFNNMLLLSKSAQTNITNFSSKNLNIENKKPIRKITLKNIDYKLGAFKDIISITAIASVFDIRNFTFFSNKNQSKIPAKFMKKLNRILIPIVKKWDGVVVSKPGDGIVILFPKEKKQRRKKRNKTKKEEKYGKYREIFKKSFMCSIEMICIFHKYYAALVKQIEKEEKTKIEYPPNRCGIGLEKGIVDISVEYDEESLAPIAATGSLINNAQRFESHSKTLYKEWKEYAPIVIPDYLYTLLPKALKKVFLKIHWHIRDKRPIAHYPNLQGMIKSVKVYGAPIENIKKFYKNNEKKFEKKEKQLSLPRTELIRAFKTKRKCKKC